VADLKSAGTARLFQPARFGGCEAGLSSGVEALAAVGTGLRLDRLVHGPAHDAQLHAVALA
jgi:hypothetical protein